MERYLSRLSAALLARGHEVTLLCLDAASRSASASAPRVERLSVPRHPRWLREFLFARAAVEAHRRSGRELLVAVRHALWADIYHPHGGSLRAGREAAMAARTPLARCLGRLWSPFRPTLRVLYWLDREVFVRSPSLLTLSVSAKVEKDLERVYPGLSFRFRRLYNAIDPDHFQGADRVERSAELRDRLGLEGTERLAFFLANNFELKGLRHAIGALEHAPQWHLVVGGAGNSGPAQRWARTLGLASRVHFLGPVADSRPLHAACDALLLPTYYDTCSLAVLEAVACGTPVVTTRSNGAAEIVEPTAAGHVVDSPSDEAALGAALLDIGTHWPRFHAAALALRGEISWTDHVDGFVRVLEEAMRT